MNSIPWNRLPFAIAPNLPLTPRTEWRGGGRLYKWDILPVSRAASLASQHAGKEITPADFFEAAARGEIILRAPAHRSARIKNLVGAGLLEIDGKALADTIEKEQVLYLPMATCRRLAQTGRASWRDIVMYKPLAPEHGSFVPMQYTLAKLVDGEPDFEAVAEDCFVSVEGMHALADDVLLDVQAAASASESDAAESRGEPAKRPPQAQAEQERIILEIIRSLGHDPKALPCRACGKRGVKSEVKGLVPQWMQHGKVFDKAWERLRANEEIQGGN